MVVCQWSADTLAVPIGLNFTSDDPECFRCATFSKDCASLIYPAIRPQLDDDDLMDEALEEHHVVHQLIAELKEIKPHSERFDAKFTVLAESVKHHIKEEEGEMLPKAEDADIDWEDLEKQVMKRIDQLMSKSSALKSSGRAKNSTRRSGGRRRVAFSHGADGEYVGFSPGFQAQSHDQPA